MARIDTTEYEMAVLCAFNYAGALETDVMEKEMQTRATSYCEQVKQLADAWKYHIKLFENSQDAQAKFYGLQSVQDLLVRSIQGAETISTQDRQELRIALLVWARDHLHEANIQQAAFIKNKLAVVFTLLIRLDFPDRWLSAFHDILGLCSTCGGDFMLDMYFRILQSIHHDVVENPGQISAADAARNTKVKDAMREMPVIQDAIKAMLDVLHRYIANDADSLNDALALVVLDTLKQYISWIDINLVVNDRCMPVLFRLLGQPAVRNVAVNCVTQIIEKGMESSRKVALIQQLDIVSVLQQLDITSHTNVCHAGVQVNKVEMDDEFAEEVAELINAVGLKLLECLHTAAAHESQVYASACRLMTDLMPMVWSCFGHETKDVSEEVLEVVHGIVLLLKHPDMTTTTTSSSAAQQRFSAKNYVPQLLFGITRQIRYQHDDTDFGKCDEDEAEFELYRLQLRKIFVNVARLEPKVVLEFLCSMASQALPQLGTMSPMDLEVLLALAYHFGEATSTAGIRQFVTEGPFREMLLALHQQILSLSPNEAVFSTKVVLMYLDLVVRYSYAVQDKPDIMSAILERMLGPFGLTHQSGHVRSRAAYLLLRLVKVITTQHLTADHVGAILQGIQSLLVVPRETDEELQKLSQQLSFEDRLYVFEIAGLLIGGHPTLSRDDPGRQIQYLHAVLAPQMTSMEQALQIVVEVVSRQQSDDERGAGAGGTRVDLRNVAIWQGRVFGAVSHIMKGFKGSAATAEQHRIFGSVLDVSIRVLNALSMHSCTLRSKSIFLLHRMLAVMGQQHLQQYVGPLLDVYIANCTVEDTMEVIQLVNQLMTSYTDAFYAILEPRFMVLIQRLCSIMPEASATTSRKLSAAVNTAAAAAAAAGMTSADLDRVTVQKYLYLFLWTVATAAGSKLHQVMFAPMNVPHLQSVLQLIHQGTTDAMDLAIQRTSLAILSPLVSKWMETAPNVVEPEAKQAAIQYVVTHFSAATFAIVRQNRFNFKDAQSTLLLKEAIRLQQTLLKLGGEQYGQLLQNTILPSLGANPEASMAYVRKLKTESEDSMRRIFQDFVEGCPYAKEHKT